MKAIGVNPVDTYIRAGTYTRKAELPWTPGTDAAGFVEAADSGAAFKPGERVYVYGAVGGVSAEKAVVEASRAFPLADGLSFEQGAARPSSSTAPAAAWASRRSSSPSRRG